MIRVLKITALVSVVVLLNAVTTLLFVQSAAPASAGPNCVNGDVNGDFVVDITDPIHLLGYIFEGTPVPVACAQSPADVFVVNPLSVTIKDRWSVDGSVTLTADISGQSGQSVYSVPSGFVFCLTDILGHYIGGNVADAVEVFRNAGTEKIFSQDVGANPRRFSCSLNSPIVFQPEDEVFVQLSNFNNNITAITISGYLVQVSNP